MILTDVEEIYRGQQRQVDKSKQDENPKSDRVDEIRDDYVNRAPSDGKSEGCQCGAFASACEGEHLGWVNPAVKRLATVH